MNIRIALSLLLLSSCTVGPNYHTPDLALPSGWISSKQHVEDKTVIDQEWWKSLGDPVLNQLIAKANADNPDLKIAEARIKQARAGVFAAKSGLLPIGNLGGKAERQANRIAFPGPFDLTKPFNTFQTGFDASWELDLFGGQRRKVEDQNATLGASIATRDDIKVSLLAEVASTYISIRQHQTELAITKNAADADSKALDIAKQRYQVGKISGIEVARTYAQAERSQAQVSHYEDMLAQTEFAMDVLLGEQPGAAHALVKDHASIPVFDGTLVLNAPAAVIANRPDIRVAERNLAASTAQKGEAVAKFFPDVSLSGFFGLLNVSSEELFKTDSKSWSAGGNVLLPILNYGALTANLKYAGARQQEALANYQKIVIAGLSDVERSIEAYEQGEKRRKRLTKTTSENKRAVTIANTRYKQGITALSAVLNEKQALYEAQLEQAAADAESAHNLIAIYKSFGGRLTPIETGKDTTSIKKKDAL